MTERDRDELLARDDADEFQSWNRWREETSIPAESSREPAETHAEAEVPSDEGGAETHAQAEVPSDEGGAEEDGSGEPSPPDDDQGYTPERARRGRHRVKRRGWARAPKRVGPRRAALAQRRRTSAKTLSKRGAVILVVVAVLVGAVVYAITRPEADDERDTNRTAAGPGGDPLTTTLVIGTRGRGEEAMWLSLVSFDDRTDEGSVTYLPAHTAVEVPGRGLQGVGNALESGDIELLMLSARFLLNIDIDHYLELAPEDARALFTSVGPLTVNVPGEVRVPAGGGNARLLFTEGDQELSPDGLVQLLYTVGLDGDDLELGPRHLAFWDALFARFEDDPSALAAAMARAGDVGRSDARFSEHAQLLQSIASAGSQQLTLSMLPVEPVAAGDSELYSIDEDQIAEYLEEVVHAAPVGDIGTTVQILNGNGVPGIGEEVAEKLVGRGFQVELTGNYRSLNVRRTLIVTYDSSPEGIEAANQARALVGVGEVQVSPLEQGIVDLTIVVGKDFLRRR